MPATIVIPVLNPRRTNLIKAVSSAAMQTVLTEVVVVMARTTSDTLRNALNLECPYPNVAVFEQTRSGFACALNEAIRRSNHERVGFLMSDDWLDPDAVRICSSIDAQVVSSGFTLHDAIGRPKFTRVPTRRVYSRLVHNWDRATYLTHFFLFSRRAIVEAGLLDESVGDSPGVDDFDLIWTLLERSASVGFTEMPLYHYRDHGGERLTLRDQREMLETFNKILLKHGLRGAVAQKLREEHSRWFGKPILSVLQEQRD